MLGGNKDFLNFTRYNFSGIKGQIQISRKGLHFYSSRVTLVFSSSDKQFLDYFLKVLMAQKELLIGTLQLVPEAIESEDAVSITESVKFLCISPIVLTQASLNDESGKRFIHPQADEFSDLLYESTIARLEESQKFSPEELASFYKFQLIADKDYLDKIQASHKKFARIYPLYDSDVKFEVRGYTFPFTLYAPQPVQQFVYEYGLGHFSHKGFGMLDVANGNAIRKQAEEKLVYV